MANEIGARRGTSYVEIWTSRSIKKQPEMELAPEETKQTTEAQQKQLEDEHHEAGEKSVQSGPFIFCGQSLTITLDGGFFTELQVQIDYFKNNLCNPQVDILFEKDFVPLRLGSEVSLNLDLYASEKTYFAFCGANPQNSAVIGECFAILLDCSDLKFYSVAVSDLRFDLTPRDFQTMVLENIQGLSNWIKHVHTNNLPLHEFGFPLKKKQSDDIQKSLPTRESYRRPSAVAARKRILDQSPTKLDQIPKIANKSREKKNKNAPTKVADCSCIDEVKKLHPLIVTLTKTSQAQSSKLVTLESSLQAMKSTLA